MIININKSNTIRNKANNYIKVMEDLIMMMKKKRKKLNNKLELIIISIQNLIKIQMNEALKVVYQIIKMYQSLIFSRINLLWII